MMRFKNIVLLQTRSKTVMNGLKDREPAVGTNFFNFGDKAFSIL